MTEAPEFKIPAVKHEVGIEWGHAGDIRIRIETVDPATGMSAASTTLHFRNAENAESMVEYVLGQIRKGRPQLSSALPS